MSRRPILTAAEMRAAEAQAIAAGTPVEELMERAGQAAAEAIWRFAGPLPALVLCGPGNNGGDGYVIARSLRHRGVDVRVAALSEPASAAAKWAASLWTGTTGPLAEAAAAPLLIDALFGTGLARPLDQDLMSQLHRLSKAAAVKAAVDLPSGVATDDGRILSPVPDFDLTVTFATLKPSHLLQPAARHMGRLVVADIGIDPESRLEAIGRPRIAAPGPDDHKYTRGQLLVVAGAMPGAAALAASAAAHAGAGYLVLAGEGGSVDNAIVRRPIEALDAILDDRRLGAVLIGPGLGRDAEAWGYLDRVMSADKPVVLDGDALWLIAEMGSPWKRSAATITTPHAGEFARVYGDEGDKVAAARTAAGRTGHIVVYKGADTVIAAPDGRAAIHAAQSHWLATAGTGDVLAGIIAAKCAAGHVPFEAAGTGVWLHGRAAELAGSGLIADDLVAALPAAVAECL